MNQLILSRLTVQLLLLHGSVSATKVDMLYRCTYSPINVSSKFACPWRLYIVFLSKMSEASKMKKCLILIKLNNEHKFIEEVLDVCLESCMRFQCRVVTAYLRLQRLSYYLVLTPEIHNETYSE